MYTLQPAVRVHESMGAGSSSAADRDEEMAIFDGEWEKIQKRELDLDRREDLEVRAEQLEVKQWDYVKRKRELTWTKRKDWMIKRGSWKLRKGL